MVHLRVDVGIEPVLAGGGLVPCGGWLLLGETNLDDALATLESVLPGDNQTQWRTTLVWHHLTIHAKRQQGQRMHGFVHPQTFHIGPFQHAGADKWHGFGVGQRHEFDEFRVAQGFDLLDQLRHRVSNPRDHHGPTLDAAQAINPLFLCAELLQVLDGEFPWLLDQALDIHCPRRGLQRMGIFRRVAFVGAELVKVVVGGGVLVVSELLHGCRPGHHRARTRQSDQFPGARGLGHGLTPGPGGKCCASDTAGQMPQHVAPLQIGLQRGDGAGRRMDEATVRSFDEHAVVLGKPKVGPDCQFLPTLRRSPGAHNNNHACWRDSRPRQAPRLHRQ